MLEDRFLKRLRKKARKGLRGWPIATIAFYGPNLSQATKVAVAIVPSENAEPQQLRDWKLAHGDIRERRFIQASACSTARVSKRRGALRPPVPRGCR